MPNDPKTPDCPVCRGLGRIQPAAGGGICPLCDGVGFVEPAAALVFADAQGIARKQTTDRVAEWLAPRLLAAFKKAGGR